MLQKAKSVMDLKRQQSSNTLVIKENNSMSSNKQTHKNDRIVSFDNQVLHVLISSYRWNEAFGFLTADTGTGKTPPAAAIREKLSGDLPLHMALKRSAPEYFILELIERYPNSVQSHGIRDQSYPLHLAVINCASPKVILTLIRRFPEALDMVDSDGDTPRLCIRKRLGPTARNALMMPTYYWTTLFAKSKKEDSSFILEQKDSEIISLKNNLSVAEKTLVQVKKSEGLLIKKVMELEHRLRKMELNAFDMQKPGSLNSKTKELSDKILKIEEVTVSSTGSISMI